MHHLNYKKNTSTKYDEKKKHNTFDYRNYTNNIRQDNNVSIETLVFDFDNRPRLFKPDKLSLSTVCINNTELDKISFIKKIIQNYKKNNKSNVENILLINSWNEWGEKMAVEPSEECGYYYLNLLRENLVELPKNYPNLFHKYTNNLSDMNENIFFKKINNYNLTGNILTHIHCDNLNYFEEYFINYLDKIPKSIIITFSKNDDNEIIINKYSNIGQFLMIKNKGMDIGGKICCLNYLYEINYMFDYILFIHSKNDSEKRSKYIEPFMNVNLEEILLNNSNILGVFPNLVLKNDNFFFGTINYRKEILNYLNSKNTDNIFVEGNCMLLKKNVIDFIFKNNLKVFYNILNDKNSFDVNWFKKYYYCGFEFDNKDLDFYKKSDYIYGNQYQPIINVDREMRDCMIEHVFERIWLNIILHLDGEYILI
jgi:hypothetical protein